MARQLLHKGNPIMDIKPNKKDTRQTVFVFKEKTNFLRIHDLKTGVSPVSMMQLKIYMSIFCLEYDFKPHSIESELRIYQEDEVMIESPDPDEILHLMDKIVTFDKAITKQKMELL